MARQQLYIDFDQYIRQGEPDQQEKAYAWSTAIGLQAVDGLTTSEYREQPRLDTPTSNHETPDKHPTSGTQLIHLKSATV